MIALHFTPELGTLRHRLAQHVAGRDGGNAQVLGEQLRLRSLAAARRAEKDHPGTVLTSRAAHGSGPSS